MRGRGRLGALLLGGMLAAAVPARAQFVSLTRCHGAFPCDRPFGLQYRPDPLIAGPYASGPSSAVSAHVDLKTKPEVELDTPLKMSGDAVDASVKAFLRRHPAPRHEPAKKPAAKEPSDPPRP